jgi:hypothetical protein
MSPDVFITIAFAGIALLVALVALVVFVPHLREEDKLRADALAGVGEPERPRRSVLAEMGSRAHWHEPRRSTPWPASGKGD